MSSLPRKGFTLIELLVVISIIGLLSSIVFASLDGARKKARIAKAQTELNQIHLAMELLFDDTGLLPRALPPSPCVQNPEIYLNDSRAGLQSTDGSFPNWNGPYMTNVPLDPWGKNYWFDPDYTCGATTIGCQGLTKTVRVIQSHGPNKAWEYGNSDDIVLILCAP
ncbi:hypothetical protein COB55_05690 [Candidatus Wolfebacteria bacterium]|nr:MAG: hypothetical protein COB55_05690 [Candidatus Wolfebacteria bacterium]